MSALVSILPAIGFVLKDGAQDLSFVWLGAVVTVICVVTFVGWSAYAFLAGSSTMESAANLPFEPEDDGGAA